DAHAVLAAAKAVASRPHENRFATRLLEKAFAAKAARPASRAVLVVGRDARWFHPPGGDRVTIARAKQMRQLLAVLVQQRLGSPGEPLSVDELLSAAWPGERLAVRRSGAMRVYMQLSRLRSLGLRNVLLSAGDGYLLHPEIELERE